MTVARSIFMSYRRCDSIDITGRIYDRLVAQFGPNSVFKDVDAIPFGVDFRKHLEREVSNCPVLLAMIGPQWLNAADSQGRRRLDNLSDWVRLEIETALNRDSVVIPVLVGGATLPKDHQLPPTLKGLAYRQSALVRQDPDFHRDVDRLMQRIEDVFNSLTLTSRLGSQDITANVPPYSAFIDDLTTALKNANQTGSSPTKGSMGRRRWLRLAGLSLLGTGGVVASQRWLPQIRATYRSRFHEPFPPLSSLANQLRTALGDSTTEIKEPPEEGFLPSYTYRSITVRGDGFPLYESQFTTTFYEEVVLTAGGYTASFPIVAIPGGQFLFGFPPDEKPLNFGQIPQTIASLDSFWMGIHPITQYQWLTVAQLPAVEIMLNPSPAYFKGENLPVEQITWREAVEFCQRLSRYTGQRFRLPTEAEWEFACRAKTTTPFHFGQTLTTDLANYNGIHLYDLETGGIFRGQTTPAGAFRRANAFGLYDMHGNVLEWCSDTWQDAFPTNQNAMDTFPQDALIATAAAPEVPITPAADVKVVRGGGWKSPPQHCQSAYRTRQNAEDRSYTIGFRIVREMDAS